MAKWAYLQRIRIKMTPSAKADNRQAKSEPPLPVNDQSKNNCFKVEQLAEISSVVFQYLNFTTVISEMKLHPSGRQGAEKKTNWVT